MPIPRPGLPYIWVTWITGLLAGDKSCKWAAWFKAHHVSYIKRPDSNAGTLARWKGEHGAMLEERVNQLKEHGWTVYVEGENKFAVKGKAAILAGGPDIVAIKDLAAGDDLLSLAETRAISLDGVPSGPPGPTRLALVEDCKTGQPRDADVWQVLTYMLFLPDTHDAVKGRELNGRVVYRGGGEVEVPAAMADPAALNRVVGLVREVGAMVGPARVPSYGECRFCDIAECPSRVEQAPEAVATEKF